MASVEIDRLAWEDLAELIATRGLPSDSEERVRRSLLTLKQFPRSGSTLAGGWRNHRALTGPWGWVSAVYKYTESEDLVVVVAIQDARCEDSARRM